MFGKKRGPPYSPDNNRIEHMFLFCFYAIYFYYSGTLNVSFRLISLVKCTVVEPCIRLSWNRLYILPVTPELDRAQPGRSYERVGSCRGPC